MDGKTGKNGIGPSWAELVKREPRLAALLAEARATVDSDPHFCANAVWYAPGGLKARLSQLVGWDAEGTDPELRTPAAYDVAYAAIYAALPDCRDCFCWDLEPRRVAELG